jgi:membrane-bound lytic murein transglycosylase D
MYGIMMEDLMDKNHITQVQRLQKGRLLWLMETRQEEQGVPYMQTANDKKTATIDEKPVVLETKKQPVVLPPMKKQPVSHDIQTEVTIVETIIESETKTNTSVTPTRPLVKSNNTVNPKPNDVTTVTVKQLPSGVSMTPSVVYSPEKPNKAIKGHIVEPKQTLFSIARLYGMSIDELYNLNDMYSGSPLRIGQEIKVYQPSSSPMTGATKPETKAIYAADNKTNLNPTITTTTTIIREVVTTQSDNLEVASASPSPITAATSSKSFSPTNSKPNYKIVHTIQAGETIYRISKIYGVSVENIKAWNNLTGNTVEVGQELMVLGANILPDYSTKSNATTYNASNNYQYHILKAGETVFRVSQIYDVSVDDIVKWNNIKNYSVIVGQKLIIKK